LTIYSTNNSKINQSENNTNNTIGDSGKKNTTSYLNVSRPVVNQSCVDEKTKYYVPHDYPSGSILIRFPDNTTSEEMEKLIKGYGLGGFQIKFLEEPMSRTKYWIVNVPSGMEIEWMCEFERNKIVEYTSVKPAAWGV
jgi:hypothetical protein